MGAGFVFDKLRGILIRPLGLKIHEPDEDKTSMAHFGIEAKHDVISVGIVTSRMQCYAS